MSEQELVDQRLGALEREVAQIKQVIATSPPTGKNWVEEISGSMVEFPEFDEVAKLGREWRQRMNETDQQD